MTFLNVTKQEQNILSHVLRLCGIAQQVHAVQWAVEDYERDCTAKRDRRDGRRCGVVTLTSPRFTTKINGAVDTDW